MSTTLGAEMPKATPTENLQRYLSKSFRKKMVRKSETHDMCWIGWGQIDFGFGKYGMQKFDFVKVNLSDSNSNLYTLTRTANKVSVSVKY